MFEDLITKRERVLCGSCENAGKHYAKKLKPGRNYRCDICKRTFGSAGSREAPTRKASDPPVQKSL